ncbi:MAG TPA: hypothetical protein VHV10_06060, partial [Ktedonobacteraceae bacterium]|nr:hypothetical protein [Ktedonobacteraceae bacterium]
MSALVGSNPQAFLDLVLPGCRFIKHHRNKLASSERQPDAIIEASHPIGERFLFNLEFQTYKQAHIPEKLLLYNVLLWWQYKLPVKSEVAYLTSNEQIDRHPLCWPTLGERDKDMLRFDYGNTEMWKKSPEDLLSLKHMELLPLLPLTQGGMEHAVVEDMFACLAGEQYRQLATMGFLFATLAFHNSKRDSDQKWLESRFRHMHDILRESPAYQWILDEGREEGIQKGKAEGRAEGKAEGLLEGMQQGSQKTAQQAAIGIVVARFPDLELFA